MKIPRQLTITTFVVFVLGLSVLAFWLGGCFVELRAVRPEFLSRSRFAQLRCALLIYHEVHGAFPPTKYQPKANGPIHSWRVLLLPHIDADKKLYSKYDFSEPWNSKNNLAVAKSVGWEAHLFSINEDMNDGDITNYLAIGDGDDWPFHKPLKARLITAGKDRFLLVEDPDSEIRWMEPKY